MAEVDLRPMTLGEVLDRTFHLYKNNFWLFAGIIALPLLINLLFGVGLVVWNSPVTNAIRSGRGMDPANTIHLGGIILIRALVAIVLYLTVIEVGHAATIFAVSDLYLGRAASVRKAFANLRGRLLRLLGVAFLVLLIVGVGFIALIVPGIILACRIGLAVPICMLEDESPAGAISRSMELTKGFAGQMFLIMLLVWILSWVAGAFFQTPFIILATQRHAQLPLALQILQQLANFIPGVLVGPIGTIAFSLMYYNLRVRKEAFDLQHLMVALGPGSGPVAAAPGAPSTA